MDEREEIGLPFRGNLERVLILVSDYESSIAGGTGRRTVSRSDTLRAAVFLHATLEDLLRGQAE